VTHAIDRVGLWSPGGGTERSIVVHRFGTAGADSKVYLQGGLHANEAPGMLILHHLIPLLRDADKAGQVRGEIVVVPEANPIGMGQFVHGYQSGRYDFTSGVNFNRQIPLIGDAAVAKMADALGRSEQNVAHARAAMREILSARRASFESEFLKSTLLGLAIDADIVIDCHSAGSAMLHVLVWHANWPEGGDLVAQLGAPLALVIADSGGGTFEEACASPWDALGDAYPDAFPVRPSFVAGLELRGDSDTDDAIVAEDAANLFRFLQRRGAIGGDPGPMPAIIAQIAPMESIDVLRASGAGIVVYRQSLGAILQPGDIVADLVDPSNADPSTTRTPIRTTRGGLLFAMAPHRVVASGHHVAMVAGSSGSVSGAHPWID